MLANSAKARTGGGGLGHGRVGTKQGIKRGKGTMLLQEIRGRQRPQSGRGDQMCEISFDGTPNRGRKKMCPRSERQASVGGVDFR